MKLKSAVVRFRPCGWRVMVLREESEGGVNGIVLPDSSALKQERMRTRVVAVGEGRRLPDGTLEPVPCRVGDYVALAQGYPAGIVYEDGEQYGVFDADAVVGVY